MKSKTVNMSKYRCTGVLFEMLVRQITADTISGLSSSPALTIMNAAFNSKTELGKEMQLYRAFFEGKSLNEAKAAHFINLIVEQRRKLDERKLAKEKYELIKEIKKHYDLKNFLSAKIPEYTIHASIYKTFLSESTAEHIDIQNIRDIVNAKFLLIEHLAGKPASRGIKKPNAFLEEYKAQSEDMRVLAYKLLIEKFNEKYANLNTKQKSLLREYINNIASTNSLHTYVNKEVPLLKQHLLELANKEANKVVQIKLNEVVSQIGKIGSDKTIKDNEITALIVAYQIVNELETRS